MRPLAVLILSLTLISISFAQDQYTQGWKSIDKGEFEKATELFLLNAKAENNPDAYLALAFLEEIQTRNELSWEYFHKALQILDNYEHYLIASMRYNGLQERLLQQDKEVIDLLYGMTDNADDGFINAYSRERLGSYLEGIARLEEALKLFEGMNVLRDWSVVGPFENVSASGFNYIYTPEREFDKKKVYSGKNQQPAQWFDIKKVRNDGWIDFKNFFASSSAIYYANTFVYSPENRIVQLRIGTSGSFKLFLNDQMMFEEDEETNNGTDTYTIETSLQRGWNKILMKLGHSDIYSCNFMLRITDQKGFPLDDLNYSTEKQSYQSYKGENADIIKSTLVDFFEERLNKDSLNPLNYILLANAYSLNDKRYEAEQTFRKGLKLFPDNLILSVNLYTLYQYEGKKAKAFSISETIRKRKINIPLIFLYEIEAESPTNNKEKFFSVYEGITYKMPESRRWVIQTLNYFAHKKNINDFYPLLERANQMFPYDVYIFYLKAYLEYYQSRDIPKAIETLEEFCNNVTTREMLTYLAEYYHNASKMEDLERTYQRILMIHPSVSELYNEMANVYYSAREYQKAIDMVEKALEICPSQTIYHQNLGLFKKALNETDESKKAYHNALKYSPFNYDARDALVSITGPEPIDKELPPFDIDALIRDVPAAGEYEGNNIVFLLLEMKNRYYSGSASEFEEEILFKIMNSSGVEDYSYIDLGQPDNEKLIIDKAVVIKPDGTEIKAEINGGEMVFNSLEVNDCIYYKYKLRSYSSGILNHYYTSTHFNYYYPVKNFRYSLTAPADVKFYFSGNNLNPDPQYVKTAGGKKLYVWERKNIPEVDFESGMPPLIDEGNILYITTIDDWNIVADWYYNLTRSRLKKHYEIEDKVNELLDGKRHLPDKEKVKIIYNYIIKNISYVYAPFLQSALIPRNAHEVLEDRIGDCKDVVTLFIAMLRETGIQADYVLVRTSNLGLAKNASPNLIFNHLIAVTYLDGEKQYYDLTATDYGIGILPDMIKNAAALEVSGKKVQPFVIHAELSPPTIITRVTEARINDDNSINLIINTRRKGEAIPWFYNNFKGLSLEKSIKKTTELISDQFTNYIVTDFKVDSTDESADELSNSVTIKVNNYLTRSGNYKLFKIPWYDVSPQLQALSYEKRNFTYQLSYIVNEKSEDIKIILPDGYEPIELPENLNISCSIADFSVVYSYKDGIISGRKMINYRSNTVPPDEYLSYKEFYEKILTNDNAQVILREVKK